MIFDLVYDSGMNRAFRRHAAIQHPTAFSPKVGARKKYAFRTEWRDYLLYNDRLSKSSAEAHV
ncbi:hypothetical protein ACFFJT_08095 [Dyella flava]|uniref:Uncharacterized protein n=1 Tax=Dyella flava TaxID=1920170 RepID=A0ABS2K8U5_9GAMM|nr:hypothetical protein [Dyella flava]MBM7127554.1 hypothetical protein [Dyella flava]